MDKIKKFIVDNKYGIAITTAIIISYKLGFNSGCKATDKAIEHFCEEATRAIDTVSHF